LPDNFFGFGFLFVWYKMELIKRTGGIRNKRGQLVQFGDFKCGICGEITNKSMTHGKRQISCGCRWASYKHGGKGTRIYKTWKKMKERCYNQNEIGYKNWGGRGISICDEWRYDFVKFRDWALANGYRDDLQIDRRDNDGNYEPSNCRFVTQAENKRNRSCNKLSMEKAQEIRELYATGKYSQRQLAKIFDIAQSGIWRAVNNLSWI
jgi:hypothetical protein